MDYDRLIAPAAAAMRPSGIRKFFDLAAEMPECISLGVGEPDFKTPWAVREAGIESLEHGRTRYTSNAGLKELRAEIARYLDRRMGLKYDPAKEVLVTVGGSEAIDMCIRTLVQPGDEVIIPEPCFVCYEPITQLTGGVPVHIATRAEDQFRLTADQLRAAITPRTKLLIFPYPNNPTGAVMSAAEMEEIAAVLRETNVLVLSDEIYSELTYGLDRHVSIASLPGMAARLRRRSGTACQSHDEDPPKLHHVRADHEPIRGHHGAAPVRRPDRDDARRVQPPPPLRRQGAERDGPDLL